MTDLTYRWMDAAEVSRVREINRQERIQTGYVMVHGRLQALAVDWDVPPWFSEGEGDHSVAYKIAFCQDHLRRGAHMIGAFSGDKLVGYGVITPNIRPGMAQLAFLHVSYGYRRQGIAARLTQDMFTWAKLNGARSIYVSATPSAPAVSFYRNQGFEPVHEPLPELYALEPEDIHMIKWLD